jgi:hypothetical protein
MPVYLSGGVRRTKDQFATSGFFVIQGCPDPQVRTRFPICFALFASLLSGCVTSYRVKVDSLAKPDANAISYSLRNASSTDKGDSLRYREAADMVRTALSGRGLYEASANLVPDVIVDVDYGVASLVRREKRWVIPPPWEKGSGEDPWRTDSNGLPVPVPLNGKEEDVTVTTYEKYLHLTARENPSPKRAGGEPMLWRVDVTSEGESKNLRKYLPVLVAASIEYVGKDSHGQKTIRIKDTDADLVFVKKGM